MSLITALSTSLSSLQVIQKNISVISNNVSNANTAGYSRKSATQESVLLGSDFGGAKISGFTRATNDTVLRSWLDTLADTGKQGAQSAYLGELGELFGTNVDNPVIAKAVERFGSAWRALEAEPENNTRQREVVQRGKELAAEIRRLSSGVEDIDRQIRTEIQDNVVTLNTALTNIQILNNQIAVAQGRGQPTGDYEDQRDKEIRKVAGMMDIKVFPRDNNQVALYTQNGYSLIDGQARQFEFNGTEVVVAGSSTAVTSYMTGGKIQGLYDMRATATPPSSDPGINVIQKLRDQLDELANAFLSTASGSFGAAYNGATSGAGELASGFFAGTGRTDIDVAAALQNGTSTVKVAGAAAVVPTFNDNTRSYTMDGLTVTNVSYSGLVTNIVAALQQAGSTVKDNFDIASGQETFFAERFQNSTGVNVDEELVNLQIMQNAYQASARLISVINEMYQTLIDTAR
jgi:flagellar hook-associated protein 1